MLSALSKRRVAPYGAADVPGKTCMRRHARHRAREHVGESRFGQQGGETKNPPCQSARRVSRKLYQLFSSFLRGASCPKSPRVAATAANSFMPERVREVKEKIQHHPALPFQMLAEIALTGRLRS